MRDLFLVRRLLPLGLLALAGLCQAATVSLFASRLYPSVYGLATDGSALYLSGATGPLRDFNSGPDTGVIGRLPLGGGRLVTLYDKTRYASASGHVAPFQLAVDAAGGLYWIDPDAGSGTGAAILKGDTAGGSPTMIFSVCCGPGVLPGDGVGLAVADGHVYFSDATGGRVAVDPAGSSATQIGPTRFNPDFNTAAYSQIAVANGKVFIADAALLRWGEAGVQKEMDQSAVLAPGVRWISLDGSSGFVDLSVGRIAHPRGIVAVGRDLYVSDRNAVWKVSQRSGRTTLVVRDPRFQDLQGLVWAGGALYVLDSQTRFGAPSGTTRSALKDGPARVWRIVP